MNRLSTKRNAYDPVTEKQLDMAVHLRDVLEKELNYLKRSRQSFETLRSLLRKRNFSEWSDHLAQMNVLAGEYRSLETQRLDILDKLAASMNIASSGLSANMLSRYFKDSDPQLKESLTQLRKETLTFKKAWIGCRSIINQCRGFNRQLQNAMYKQQKTAMTYDSFGGINLNRQACFISCSF